MTAYERLTERFRATVRSAGGGVAAACHATLSVLPVQRAAIVIDEDDAGVQPWCATDEVAAGIEAMQATAGEGPAVDAVATGLPVPVADLARACERWPGFAAALERTHFSGAMIAVPLSVGRVHLGALDLYRAAPGPVDMHMVAASMYIADLIAEELVPVGSAGHPAAVLAPHWLEQPLASRVIHQAAGMVIAQLGITGSDAYVCLRAYAFGHAMSLSEVAEQVVARRIRFDGQ
ncbi:GAF and ANTAR domain-containing protein [Nocardia alni]|uniref:GAF and ANTAR domain-containing protein n=1 Tax=Nocardia alni TaxID=2815723 RepID=UPI001C22C77F|nr:GAF and ANTAR domain-containing protein [Nocardia alni]